MYECRPKAMTSTISAVGHSIVLEPNQGLTNINDKKYAILVLLFGNYKNVTLAVGIKVKFLIFIKFIK